MKKEEENKNKKKPVEKREFLRKNEGLRATNVRLK